SFRFFYRGSGCSALSYGSVAGGSSVVHAGYVEEKDREPFFSNLQKAMEKASERYGKNRNPAFGMPDHRWTPAVVMAIVRDAKVALTTTVTSEIVPAGGFTDIGPLTGVSQRATAWSLTREVFQVRICTCSGSYE
ncbi:unnamed protein product, partial [Hapterophycus canaliculatus]